jgi:hypothetical protein
MSIETNNYVFTLPSYQKNSNGIVCIWEAAYQFSKFRNVIIIITDSQLTKIPEKFKDIKIYFLDSQLKSNRSNITHISKANFDIKDIQVQPDDPHNYFDNLDLEDYGLNTSRTVRYLMCKSLLLSESLLTMSPNSYGLSYSNAVSTVFPSYLIISDKILNINNSFEKLKKKNKVLIYYGKARYGLSFKNLKKIIDQFDEYEIVHRLYPKDTNELYKKISESALFISIDPLTSLIHESTLIGTPAYVYDSVFKEFYDKFDFELHGFYYDLKPSELTKVFKDSENLSEKAVNTAKDFMANIEERTKKTIDNIEGHFLNNISNEGIIKDAINEDITFFKEKWKVPAIFNCTSYRTIYRYHITNKYKIFALLALYINRLRVSFRNSFILKYLTTEEKTIIKKYLKRNFIREDIKLKEQNKIKKFW